MQPIKPDTDFNRAVARVGQAVQIDEARHADMGTAPEGVSMPDLEIPKVIERTEASLAHEATRTTSYDAERSKRKKLLPAIATLGLALGGLAADRAISGSTAPDYRPIATSISADKANQAPLAQPNPPTTEEVQAAVKVANQP